MFCLIFFQLTNSVSPILLMIFPKVLLDQLMNTNDIFKLLQTVLLFSLGIFIGQTASSFYRMKLFIVVGLFWKSFNTIFAIIFRKLIIQIWKIQNFWFEAECWKFLYANGQGFSFVLDQSMNIIGKVIIFATVIGIIASLNVLVLFLFLLLAGINSLAQMNLKKTYANLELEKNPKEKIILSIKSVSKSSFWKRNSDKWRQSIVFLII